MSFLFKDLKADPDKVSVITNMSPLTDVSGVGRLLKMVNQLAKFLPNFDDIFNLLHELLSKKNLFDWDIAQQKAFEKIQNILTHLPVISHLLGEAENHVDYITACLSASNNLLQKIRHEFLLDRYVHN